MTTEIQNLNRRIYPALGSFSAKRLQIALTLSEGKFKGGKGNSYIISDLAMSVKIEKLGAPDFGKATAEIYGLPLEIMQQLTTLTMRPMFTFKNYINISAGDDLEGLSEIYKGAITSASVDFNGAPDVKFKIESRLGYFGSVTVQQENFISGVQPAQNFIKQQAEKLGYTFKNEGVQSSIRNATFSGSPIEQARQCAAQVGAELIIDDDCLILCNGQRKGSVPILDADSGLLGYPVMTQNGINFKAIFNKNFRFAGLVELRSIVPKVNGQWRIVKLTHDLDANLPNSGKWESSITAYYPHLSGITGKFC